MQNSSLAVDSPVSPRPGDAACAWVLVYVLLLPLPGPAEGILVLGGVWTLLRLCLARARGQLGDLLSPAALGMVSLLFLAYWLPQAVAAVDAVDPGQAWRKALGALRYLPFMWLVAMAVATAPRRARLGSALGALALVWAADAVLQPLLGSSPLLWLLDFLKQAAGGTPLCPPDDYQALGRFNGIFSECNPKLGQVLAVLAPFALLRPGQGKGGWLAAAALIAVAVVLSGSRAAWLSLALVLLVSGWKQLGGRAVAAVALCAVLLGALALPRVPQLADRLDRTLAVLEDRDDALDAALSGRGRIWAAAACMIADHPINGVGVRGFRHAWAGCDPQPGVAPAWGDGPALHAHQLVLEILAETGLIGLLLWLAGAALAVRAWRYANAAARARALPAAVAAGVAVFPFNTHLAVYSAFWGGITLMLVALYAGALMAGDTEA